MQHVHILCWLQQNGLHSLTRSWGLVMSEEEGLHESDNKMCWYLMHLKHSNTRSPYSLCPLFQRLEQIAIASMIHCTKQHMGSLKMMIKSHTFDISKQNNTHLLILCCFCSKLVNNAVLLPRQQRNLPAGRLLVQQTHIIDIITLILSWFTTQFCHNNTFCTKCLSLLGMKLC